MTQAHESNFYRASLGPAPGRPALSGRLNADVCIIGGGFTGLSAALHLATAGTQVVLLEAEAIGHGASGRNGGQIHTGYRKTQNGLERWLGRPHARDLWNLSEEAKSLICELTARYGIDCALKRGLVIAAHDHGAIGELAEDTEYLRTYYGYTAARMMDADETARALGTPVYPAARFDSGGGHLQPLAFARGLAAAAEDAGARLYEHTRVIRIEAPDSGVRAICESGAVGASHAIVACDAYSGQLLPELAPYIAHLESFIAATEPLPDELYEAVLPGDTAVADTRHVLDYYRKSVDRRMLFAGREAYFAIPHDIAAIVRPRMEKVYPALKRVRIEYAWSGTVGITRTRMPHLGRQAQRVFFAHGYSGQGVALAAMSGKLLAEAILGNSERFDALARVPARPFPGGGWVRRPLVSAGLLWYRLLDFV